jgi:hypothetical protein
MATPGEQAKYILESTFDWVAGSVITYVAPSGVNTNLPCILHDDTVKNRREVLEVANAGAIVDSVTLRVIFKTADLITAGIVLDSGGYMWYRDCRWDFPSNEPFATDESTPFADALNIFTVLYIRRNAELLHSTPSSTDPTFGFDSWT